MRILGRFFVVWHPLFSIYASKSKSLNGPLSLVDFSESISAITHIRSFKSVLVKKPFIWLHRHKMSDWKWEQKIWRCEALASIFEQIPGRRNSSKIYLSRLKYPYPTFSISHEISKNILYSVFDIYWISNTVSYDVKHIRCWVGCEVPVLTWLEPF